MMAYTVEEFLKTIIPMAKQNMKKTGVLASLTIAQAFLESQYGNSKLTTEGNNLFGMKGAYEGQSVTMPTTEYEGGMRKTILAAFRKYPSWQESVDDHASLVSKSTRYIKVITAKNYTEACKAIQEAGYSTDPHYAEQLIQLIEKYKLSEYDKKEKGSVASIVIELNGVKKEVETVNVEGYNYIKLRDLADSKIVVDYDAANKLPIVKVVE